MHLISSLGSLVVRNANGSINFEATATAVKDALIMEVENTAIRDSEIETILDSVYARLGVDIYPSPEVVSIAAASMVGNDLTKMATVSEEIRNYLARSPHFKGERGRKGGLRRLPR